MSKFMTPEQYSEWCEKPGRTLAEIEAMAIEQQSQVRATQLEAAGLDVDAYSRLPRDAQAMVEDAAAAQFAQEFEDAEAEERADARLEARREQEEQEAFAEEQAAIQTEFANRHPDRFPSSENGNLFRDEYVAAFRAADPNVIEIVWDLESMETVFQETEQAGKFPVTRVFKS